MFKTILASALAISMAVPAVGVFAATPPDCALNHVAAAQQLRERLQMGGHILRDRLAGATLFIPAEKGVTTDYLKRIADAPQAQMAAGTAMKDCPFGVAGSTIEVSSNNSGYLIVAIRSKDEGQRSRGPPPPHHRRLPRHRCSKWPHARSDVPVAID